MYLASITLSSHLSIQSVECGRASVTFIFGFAEGVKATSSVLPLPCVPSKLLALLASECQVLVVVVVVVFDRICSISLFVCGLIQ